MIRAGARSAEHTMPAVLVQDVVVAGQDKMVAAGLAGGGVLELDK